MAVYKVIQDIEAEDKLLGPLTLKGFIYAAITGLLAFIDIRLLIGGTPVLIKLIITLLFLPPMLLFAVLASPLGRQQPTEVWLLSHILFLVKPKIRKWDQSGIKELVKITAPKRQERILTKDFSQTEVTSRLAALANTLDSRGWAVKNTAVNLPRNGPADALGESDERLAAATTLEATEPVVEVHAADDVLDEQNNPTAQNMQSLIAQAEEERRLELMRQVEMARAKAAEAAKLQKKAKEIDEKIAAEPPIIKAGATRYAVTHGDQTAKLELANAGNALSVASIAQLANRRIGAAVGEIEVPLR